MGDEDMGDLEKMINMNNNVIRSPTRIRITGNGTKVQILNLSSTQTHCYVNFVVCMK